MPPKPEVTRQTPTPKKTVKSKPKLSQGNADSDDPWERLGTETVRSGFLKMLLFGVSGTGKTRTASSFPGKILWIICSGTQRSGELEGLDDKTLEKITPIHIRNTGEILRLVLKQRETNTFSTVVLDHATGLQDYALKEVLDIPELPAQLSFGIAARDQWNEVNGNCKEILRALLNLECNVVIIAQERDFNDKMDSGQSDSINPAIGPALTPGTAIWLTPTCSYVCQLFKRAQTEIMSQTIEGSDEPTEIEVPTGEVEFCARIAPHESVMTKFRISGDKLPKFIVNPSYAKFIKLIKDGQKHAGTQ